MDVYHYHPNTFEYIGTSLAQPDPKDVGKFLIPANATTTAPPAVSANQVAVYDVVNDTWSVSEDYRGTIYSTTDQSSIVHETLGPMPPGYTNIAPPDIYHSWDSVSNSWVFDLVKYKESAKARILDSMNSALASGYTTTGLTTNYTMNCSIEDINKLKSGYDLAQALNQTSMDIRDYNNVVHTAVPLTDIWSIIIELGTYYQTLLNKKWSLQSQIDAAVDRAAVDAVVW